MSQPTAVPSTRTSRNSVEEFDLITLEIFEVSALMGLVEQIEAAGGDGGDFRTMAVGLGALSRVIVGKMERVQTHAKVLLDGVAE